MSYGTYKFTWKCQNCIDYLKIHVLMWKVTRKLLKIDLESWKLARKLKNWFENGLTSSKIDNHTDIDPFFGFSL